MGNCAEIFYAINVDVCSLTLWVSFSYVYKIGNCVIFLNTFYTKTRLSQGLLPDIELIKKCFLQYTVWKMLSKLKNLIFWNKFPESFNLTE